MSNKSKNVNCVLVIYHGDETQFPRLLELSNWRKEAVTEFIDNRTEYLKVPDRQVFESSERRLREKSRERIDFDYFLYVDQQISYLVTKERFKKSGKLITHKSFPKGYEIKPSLLLEQVGGAPNWIGEDVTPKNKSGKELTFIGQVVG